MVFGGVWGGMGGEGGYGGKTICYVLFKEPPLPFYIFIKIKWFVWHFLVRFFRQKQRGFSPKVAITFLIGGGLGFGGRKSN